MKIKLQGIGIIKNSELELDGLTVITGDNSSGKTTVGKVIYSLFDAVSDLSSKAEADKLFCARRTLRDIRRDLDFLSYLYGTSKKENITTSALYTLFSQYFFMRRQDCILLANKVYEEIRVFHDLGLITFDDEDKRFLYKTIEQRYFKKNDENYSVDEFIESQLEYALETLEDLFEKLDCDSQLIDYARSNISETLKVEFQGQIQPLIADLEKSSIIVENSKICFYFDIKNNDIVNNNEPVYFDSTIKKTFFVDNPFILDTGAFTREPEVYITNNNDDNFFNRHRILPHDVKLKSFLRSDDTSIFESNILERQFKEINSKINEIISGDFEFTNDGDYYIDKGRKLRFSNLATGSKMFSILKLLINKGAMNDSTLLVLDEPEAHLHPAWQNKFAEIIVMLVKEMNVKVLLTSHSPNFVLAIDAFMRKYKINDKTNFYQTRLLDDGFAEYVNVNDNMGLIYSDFVQYLTEVKMLRNKYMHDWSEKDD